MQLTRSIEINLSNLWEPEMFGVFVMRNSKVSFFFNNGKYLYVMEDNVPQVLLSYPKGRALPLPADWIIKDTPGSPYLLLNETLGINLRNNGQVSPLPDELLTEYKRCLIPPMHYLLSIVINPLIWSHIILLKMA